MSNPPGPAIPPTADAVDAADAADAERTGRHLCMLRELGDMAMDFARQVHRAGTPAPAEPQAPLPPGTHPPALVFARIASCLRQTLAQEARVAADHRARTADAAAAADRARGAARNMAIRRIRHGIDTAIRADRIAPRSPGLALRVEEHLDNLETADELAADRPLADIVARICRRLRITPPAAADSAEPPVPPPQFASQPAPVPDLLVAVPS